MSTSLTVLLVGEEAAGVRALQMVLDGGHRVARVLTGSPGQPETPVQRAAERAGIATLPAALVRESAFGEDVRKLGVDLLLNVHSLHLAADGVLQAPRIGSFNVHPGPLPGYAGFNGVSWAIYRGEREYGVSLHWMVRRVHAGDVAFRAAVAMVPDDTALSLGTRCARAEVALVARLLEAARAPSAIPHEPQDLSRRRYYAAAEVPQAGRIDWFRPGREVVRFVRASDCGPFPSPWGRPRTRLDGQEVSVLAAEATGRPADAAPGTLVVDARNRVCVAAADEWVELKQVAVDGGREVSPREAFHLWASPTGGVSSPHVAGAQHSVLEGASGVRPFRDKTL